MKNLIYFLKDIIVKAGELALKIRATNLEINYKKDLSPVSNADILVEKFIKAQLKKISTTIPIISEESQYFSEFKINSFSSYKNHFWLVDPIDGSKNFIKNGNNFTINIALVKNHIPILGIIYEPFYQKLYYTDSNNKLHIESYQKIPKLSVLKNFTKQNFVVVLGNSKINHQTQKYLKENSLNQILYLPSSMKLCLIAEGLADIYPKFGPTMEWDLAAGQVLINSTGGKVLDLNNQELVYGKNNFINPYILAMSKQYFVKKHST